MKTNLNTRNGNLKLRLIRICTERRSYRAINAWFRSNEY